MSREIPGWSYHNSANSTLVRPTDNLVNLRNVSSLEEHLTKVANDPDSDDYQTNYAVELKSLGLRFEVEGSTNPVYLDDIFFQGVHTKLGNPSNARNSLDPENEDDPQPNNYLIEKPQYTLSYSDENKGPNWVSWQLNQSWLGELKQNDARNNRSDNYPPVGFTPAFSPDFPDEVGPPDASFPIGQIPISGDYPWVPDNALPADWVVTQPPDYRENNIIPDLRVQRGHMMPVDDRNRTFKDVYSTFTTTNIIPQNRDLNQFFNSPWRGLELESNNAVACNSNRELYIIAGGAEYDPERPEIIDTPDGPRFQPPGEIRNFVTTNDEGRVVLGGTNDTWTTNPKGIGIPAYAWKVVVPLEAGQGVADITKDTQVTAVIFNNLAAPAAGTYELPNGTDLTVENPSEWREWRVSVDDLEEITGYDFLSNVPTEIQAIIEDRIGNFNP